MQPPSRDPLHRGGSVPAWSGRKRPTATRGGFGGGGGGGLGGGGHHSRASMNATFDELVDGGDGDGGGDGGRTGNGGGSDGHIGSANASNKRRVPLLGLSNVRSYVEPRATSHSSVSSFRPPRPLDKQERKPIGLAGGDEFLRALIPFKPRGALGSVGVFPRRRLANADSGGDVSLFDNLGRLHSAAAMEIDEDGAMIALPGSA